MATVQLAILAGDEQTVECFNSVRMIIPLAGKSTEGQWCATSGASDLEKTSKVGDGHRRIRELRPWVYFDHV
jgi:hypothetical protein